MDAWQMQEAKARLSELVGRAQSQGPQNITVHGKSVAVVVSREMFNRLSGRHVPLSAFIQASPLAEAENDFELPPRSSEQAREIDG